MSTPNDEQKSHSSLSFRIAKNIASKTASTKLGREVLLHFLGAEGERFIGALKDAVTAHHGSTVGDKFNRHVLKFAVKTKLLYEEKRVSESSFAAAGQILPTLALDTVDCFKQADKARLDALHLSLQNFSKAIIETFRNMVKPKNVEKLSTMLSTITDLAFLQRTFTDSAVKKHRDVMSECLTVLLSNPSVRNVLSLDAAEAMRQVKAASAQYVACNVKECKESTVSYEVKGDRKPRRSPLCATHHMQYLQRVKRSGSLDAYLTIFDRPASEAYLLEHLNFIINRGPSEFSELKAVTEGLNSVMLDSKEKTVLWSEQHKQAHELADLFLLSYRFYIAVQKFKELGRSSQKSRGDMLYQKHIRPQLGSSRMSESRGRSSTASSPLLSSQPRYVFNLELPEDIVNELSEKFAYGAPPLRGDVFDKAYQFVQYRMQALFEVLFVRTPALDRFVDMLTPKK